MKAKRKEWVCWPDLQDELKPYLSHLKGHVLNAGSGARAIHLPYCTEVTNMDIIEFPSVDVVGSVESMPFQDKSFDSILNVAVLEHVRHPWKAVEEFRRVLKPEGVLVCVVPFFQPVHLIPSDYFRFTSDGITALLEDSDFEIVSLHETHTVWHTLGWMAEDSFKDRGIIFRTLIYPFRCLFYFLSKKGTTKSSSWPNALTVLARKRG